MKSGSCVWHWTFHWLYNWMLNFFFFRRLISLLGLKTNKKKCIIIYSWTIVSMFWHLGEIFKAIILGNITNYGIFFSNRIKYIWFILIVCIITGKWVWSLLLLITYLFHWKWRSRFYGFSITFFLFSFCVLNKIN